MKSLAINGGAPIRDTHLPYGQQWIDEDDIDAVAETLRSNYLTTGPQVKAFEDAVAEYTGAKYAVAVSNGTTALHCATFAAGIGPGDEVIVSPMTFAASANCVLYQGGTPVFADIDPVTYNINPDEIRKKITNKTKAIIPVDYTGQPANYDAIMGIAQEYGLKVIADGAHSLGGFYGKQPVGTIADMTEFSFHPVKAITTGEGGMVTTNDPELYEKLNLFRTHGITRDSKLLTKNEGPWYYEQLALGNNYRITDIQCTLGIRQLKKLNQFIERRKVIVNRYSKAFEKMEEVIVPKQLEGTTSAWHLYVLQLNLEQLTVDRRVIFEALQAENIGVNVHYIPVHRHPYYESLGYPKGLCPVAERLYERILSLPLFPKMQDADVEDVISGVQKVIRAFRR